MLLWYDDSMFLCFCIIIIILLLYYYIIRADDYPWEALRCRLKGQGPAPRPQAERVDQAPWERQARTDLPHPTPWLSVADTRHRPNQAAPQHQPSKPTPCRAADRAHASQTAQPATIVAHTRATSRRRPHPKKREESLDGHNPRTELTPPVGTHSSPPKRRQSSKSFSHL